MLFSICRAVVLAFFALCVQRKAHTYAYDYTISTALGTYSKLTKDWYNRAVALVELHLKPLIVSFSLFLTAVK